MTAKAERLRSRKGVAAAVLVDEFDAGLCRSDVGLRKIFASEQRQLSQDLCTSEV